MTSVGDDAVLHRLDATMLPGVRPSISFASLPTALDAAVHLVDGDNGRLVDDNALPARRRRYWSGAEVDRQVTENNDNIERRLKPPTPSGEWDRASPARRRALDSVLPVIFDSWRHRPPA